MASLESKLQAASGAFIGLFLALHLSNLFSVLHSPALYNSFQDRLRVVYQQPAFEIILLFSIALHGLLGVRSMLKNRPSFAKVSLTTRIQRLTGWYLLAVIAGHIFFTRFFGPAIRAEGLGFTLVSLGFFFFPYYIILGISGVLHSIHGMSLALKRFSLPSAFLDSRIVRGFALLLSLLVVVALLFMGGVLRTLPYDVYNNAYAQKYKTMMAAFF